MERSPRYRIDQGRASLPFSASEYDLRIGGLRAIMDATGVETTVLTSMHGIAYYSGFLRGLHAPPSALVVTASEDVTISAGAGTNRRWPGGHGEDLCYDEAERDGFWRAILSVTRPGRVVGYEGDDLPDAHLDRLKAILDPAGLVDVAPATARQRMRRSVAEIALIRRVGKVADAGARAIRDAVKAGVRESDVAAAGRDAMESETARSVPAAECQDSRVWFRSGPNTAAAREPAGARKLQAGDILSLGVAPVIAGYCAALERTMFLGEVDAASLKIWQATVAAHELAMALPKPGIRLAEVAATIDGFLEDRGLGQYRTGAPPGQDCRCEPALDPGEYTDTMLEPGMVIAVTTGLTVPDGRPGAGGYRARDILVITGNGNKQITKLPRGTEFNLIG
ncbi:MAG: M24 family metallopeptidase [Paracoccaceae bacterium]